MTLSELAKKFDTFYEAFREGRREYMETSGDKMETQVKANIAADVNDSDGTLTAAVTKAVGTGGGYAAVRNNWHIARHAHLVENGHWMRGHDGRLLTLKNGGSWVVGRKMYERAIMELKDELVADAGKMTDKVVKEHFG